MNAASSLDEIFFPYASRKNAEVLAKQGRFVHYTTAEVAAKILQSGEMWMRNATTLNDYSEIEYGFECLNNAYKSAAGQSFKNALNEIFPNFSESLERTFNEWLPNIRANTFLACISEHLDSEDEIGRLSMWRAYGGSAGVAIVLNNQVFQSNTSLLSVYSSPVAYWSHAQVQPYLSSIGESIRANAALLRSSGTEEVRGAIFNMLQFAVMSIKHPGFHEEREWRVIHTPSFGTSERLAKAIETIRGIPQMVYKIPLRDDPSIGLVGAELPRLLNRLVIGPTEFPGAMRDAFVQLLQQSGVPGAASKVFVSDIPLRRNSE